MIPKPKKDHLQPEYHKPIFLLTIMCKELEKLYRLKLYIKPRPDQHAFRASCSTTTQLIKQID